MNRSAQIQHDRIRWVATRSIMLGLWLAIAPSTLAHSATVEVAPRSSMPSMLVAQTYNPPPPSGQGTSSTPGGVRGTCNGVSSASLLAIAPQSHTGQTSSTRPTVAWYVPDEAPYDIVFQLFQRDADTPLYDVTMTSHKGWMTWTPPANSPGLTVGETYRWRVILICDRNRPSLSMRDGAAFKVVVSPSITAAASDPVAYARQLAAAGVWYDALATILNAPPTAQLRSLRIELLNELAQLESATDTRRADNLRSLATLEP